MKLTYTIPAAALALSLTAMSLSANTADTQADNSQFEAPSFSFIDAADLAQKTAPGTLVSMELSDDEIEERMYLAELEAADSHSFVLIDAENGDVELTQITKASSPEIMNGFSALQAFEDEAEFEAELADFAEDLRMLQDMCSDDLIDIDEARLFSDNEDLTAEEIDAIGKDICEETLGNTSDS